MRPSILEIIIKIAFALFLAHTSLSLYEHSAAWTFIQNVNLIFHEAGHVIFSFFGDFIHVLGGTLMELGIPLCITFYFYRKKEWYSSAFGLWWFSTALWGVSVYARDARSQLLPLITGDPNSHDWTYLLGRLHLLHYDTFIGNIFLGLSVAVCMISFVLFFDFIAQSWRKPPA